MNYKLKSLQGGYCVGCDIGDFVFILNKIKNIDSNNNGLIYKKEGNAMYNVMYNTMSGQICFKSFNMNSIEKIQIPHNANKLINSIINNIIKSNILKNITTSPNQELNLS